MIAPCGMDCATCRAHLRENNPCHGCRRAQKNKPKTRVNCKIRLCTKRHGKFCCDCQEFPCERLLHLDKRYRKKYAMSEIENLNFIKNKGIENFIEHENKLFIKNNKIHCVHDKKYYTIKNENDLA